MSDLNKRMKHFYESILGIWIIQAAANFMPILHFRNHPEYRRAYKEGEEAGGSELNEFFIAVFQDFSQAVFNHRLSSDTWSSRAALFLNPFNIQRVLTGEVLRVSNSDDASDVVNLIASPRSSVSKCREEKPWVLENGNVTGAVTKKFWHGCHLALQAVGAISNSFMKDVVETLPSLEKVETMTLGAKSGDSTPCPSPPGSPLRLDTEPTDASIRAAEEKSLTRGTSYPSGGGGAASYKKEPGESDKVDGLSSKYSKMLDTLLIRASNLINGDFDLSSSEWYHSTTRSRSFSNASSVASNATTVSASSVTPEAASPAHSPGKL